MITERDLPSTLCPKNVTTLSLCISDIDESILTVFTAVANTALDVYQVLCLPSLSLRQSLCQRWEFFLWSVGVTVFTAVANTALDVYQVLCLPSLSLRQSLCQRWEFFLWSVGVKVTWRYCWDILLSQQMLVAIIVSFAIILFSARQCTGASCIQHSPTAAVLNSQSPFSWAMAQ